MVVITARRHEERAGIVPDHLVQPESDMVETSRALQVGDIEMYVADHGSSRNAGPVESAGTVLRGAQQTLLVERNGRHRQLSVVVRPRRAWAIGVDLDAQSVRVREVDRLADEMV